MAKMTAKTLTKYIVVAGLMSFVIIFIIMQFSTGFDFSKMGEAVSKANWWWILAATLCNVASFFCEAFQLWFLSRALGKRPGFWRMMQIYFVGNFFSNATPSTSGGEPFQIYFMMDDGFSVAEGMVMVAVRGLISVMVRILYVLITVAMIALGIFRLNLNFTFDLIFYITLAAFTLLVVAGFIVITNPHIFSFLVKFFSRFRWIRKLAKIQDPEQFIQKGELFLGEIRSSAKLLIQGKKIWMIGAIFNSILTWLLLKTMPFFIMLALNEHPNIFVIFAIGVISQLATAWVPTPGAVGGIETGMLAFASTMQTPGNIGLFVFIYRLMDYHMDVLVGAPIALRLLSKKLGKNTSNADLSALTSQISQRMEEEKEKMAQEELASEHKTN